MDVHQAIDKAMKLREKMEDLHNSIDDVTERIRNFRHREEEQGYDGEEDIAGNLNKEWERYVKEQSKVRDQLRNLESEHDLEYNHDDKSYAYGDDDDAEEDA